MQSPTRQNFRLREGLQVSGLTLELLMPLILQVPLTIINNHIASSKHTNNNCMGNNEHKVVTTAVASLQ